MLGKHKLVFLALIGLLPFSWGCSIIIANSGISSDDELYFLQTRDEVREKFGEAEKTLRCPSENIVEYRWIRKRVGYSWYMDPQFYLAGLGLWEIISLPITAARSEMAMFHYAFVYDEMDQILYHYDLKVTARAQFDMATRPLAEKLYQQLKFGKSLWTTCISQYIEEARQRAACIGFTLDVEEQLEFEDMRIVGEWVDSKQIMEIEGRMDIKQMPHGRFWFFD